MLAPQPFYSERGTPMNVRLLCRVLGEAGHKVDLLVFPTGQDVVLENTTIIRLPNLFRVSTIPTGPSRIKLAYDCLLAVHALWLCLTRKYDVIHGIEEGGFLSVFWGRLFRKKSVYDMDSCISEQLRYSKFISRESLLSQVKRLEKWSLKQASLVITVCEALTETARSFAPNAKIVQIEDIPISAPEDSRDSEKTAEQLVERYGLSDSARVVYTGNLVGYQGIDLLLDAWKVFLGLDRSAQAARLVIVGGPEERAEHYRRLAARHGTADSISWIGPRPSGEMSAWMALSDVLVSPRSEGDNTPLKIYSYMSSGRPIVATRRRTHTQVLDDTMAFLPEPNPEEFGRALHETLTDRESSRAKGAKARAAVEAHYSYPVFREKLLGAYEALAPAIPVADVREEKS